MALPPTRTDRRVRKTYGTTKPPALEVGERAAGMDVTRPFSPGEPIGPYDGYSRHPRQQNFVTGYNIAARPRSHERVAFDTLKGFIEAYDVAQIAIWHRIDSIRAMDWSLVPAPGFAGDADDAIARGKAALEYPDGEIPFASWLAKWLYDILAYDAGTLYRLRNRRGDVIGLSAVDGTTVAPLLDYWGRSPKPPAEAYVQYVNGVPWNWLTRDDLIYEPFRPITGSPYGRAPLESILLNANTDLRFQAYFLQRFTDGNIPAAFASAPETWTPQQIEQFQEYWDAFMLGDQSVKNQIRWIPGGSNIAWSNEKNFDDKFSLFLMRKSLAAYHVVPADVGFTDDVNRSSGETQGDVQHRIGDLPLIGHAEGILSAFLRRDLRLPVVFSFDTGQEKEDRLALAQAWKLYVDAGAASPDEMREELLGLPGDPQRPTPRFYATTRSGPIPLLAIDGTAGKVDPETFGPRADQPVIYQPFVSPPGVVAAEGTTDHTASTNAEDAYQQAMRQQLQAEDAGQSVAKDGPTAGITTGTGIVGYDLIGHDDEDEEGDEPDREQLVKAELAAFRRYRAGQRRRGKPWRDFQFAHVDPTVGQELNMLGRSAVGDARLAKAGAGDPKGDAPGGAWPGWVWYQRLVDYWGPRIADATSGAVTEQQARQAVADYRAGDLHDTEADRRAMVALVALWLGSQGIDPAPALAEPVGRMLTDAYLIGTVSAQAAVGGGRPDLADWTPGDTDAARARLDDLGVTDRFDATVAEDPDVARVIADGALADAARALIDGVDGGGGDGDVATALADALTDRDKAAGAVLTAVVTAAGAAAMAAYAATGVEMGRWVTESDNVCPACRANADGGPVLIGEAYPSGHTNVPAHPRCACAIQPA